MQLLVILFSLFTAADLSNAWAAQPATSRCDLWTNVTSSGQAGEVSARIEQKDQQALDVTLPARQTEILKRFNYFREDLNQALRGERGKLIAAALDRLYNPRPSRFAVPEDTVQKVLDEVAPRFVSWLKDSHRVLAQEFKIHQGHLDLKYNVLLDIDYSKREPRQQEALDQIRRLVSELNGALIQLRHISLLTHRFRVLAPAPSAGVAFLNAQSPNRYTREIDKNQSTALSSSNQTFTNVNGGIL